MKHLKIRDLQDGTVLDLKRASDDFESEIKGVELSEQDQAYIDSLPRVETKSSQNEETLAQLVEENTEKKKQYRLPDQELMRRNEAQRRGKSMHHLIFLKKLRDAGIQCWYNEVPFQGMIGLRAVRKGYEQLGAQYVCAVKLGWTTEYDFFHYDRHGVELGKKFIGWRSVLLQLINKGILTEEQAHRIFGEPSLNDASILYRRALYNMRNHRPIESTEKGILG